MDLSVIIPFCNEMPSIIWTLRIVGEELSNRGIEFEVIAINNHCKQNEDKGHMDDGGPEVVKAFAKLHPWLTYLEYKDKLSHWNAKRIGVNHSTGRILMFLDGHIALSRDSIFGMYEYYTNHEKELNGSLHLPVTYKIHESHRLIYKFVLEGGHYYWYKFTPFRPGIHPMDSAFEVPCMSCCGVMLSRKIYDYFGGWPEELGVYGGGEHFLNYTLAVLGMRKWIYPMGTCYHHGSGRGYEWWYDDYIRNIILAHYLFGGEKIAQNFISVAKGRPEVLHSMLQGVIKTSKEQRILIKSRQKMEITTWKNAWLS